MSESQSKLSPLIFLQVEASFQVCPPCTLSRCPNPNLFDSSESYRDKQLSSLYLFDDNVMYNSTSPIKMQSNGQKIKKHSETLEAGSEANVPRMVEAFRPLIEDSVRVSELLPYLHFLGKSTVNDIYHNIPK